MGAQRAPINSMKPALVRPVGDITPLVSGLPGPPKAPFPSRAHLSTGQKPAAAHPAAKAGSGITSRGPRRTTWQPWPTPSVSPTALLPRPRRSPCPDAPRTSMPESTLCTEMRPVLVPQVVPRQPGRHRKIRHWAWPALTDRVSTLRGEAQLANYFDLKKSGCGL
jgi:hypothetical protein